MIMPHIWIFETAVDYFGANFVSHTEMLRHAGRCFFKFLSLRCVTLSMVDVYEHCLTLNVFIITKKDDKELVQVNK